MVVDATELTGLISLASQGRKWTINRCVSWMIGQTEDLQDGYEILILTF